MDKAILKNAEFLNKIVANPEIFGHEVDEEGGEDEDGGEGEGSGVIGSCDLSGVLGWLEVSVKWRRLVMVVLTWT